MLAFMLLPMTPRIDYNEDEDHKTQSDEHNDSRIIIPDLFHSARQLGPIHCAPPYTSAWQK
jgi:hypothetical protein